MVNIKIAFFTLGLQPMFIRFLHMKQTLTKSNVFFSFGTWGQIIFSKMATLFKNMWIFWTFSQIWGISQHKFNPTMIGFNNCAFFILGFPLQFSSPTEYMTFLIYKTYWHVWNTSLCELNQYKLKYCSQKIMTFKKSFKWAV